MPCDIAIPASHPLSSASQALIRRAALLLSSLFTLDGKEYRLCMASNNLSMFSRLLHIGREGWRLPCLFRFVVVSALSVHCCILSPSLLHRPLQIYAPHTRNLKHATTSPLYENQTRPLSLSLSLLQKLPSFSQTMPAPWFGISASWL
jgi:hypothetical protein